MHEHQGASTPAINRLCSLGGDGGTSNHGRISIATVNRLFLLTLPAHLQMNYGKELDSTHRDALRAQIIRSALNG
jgi:protein-arginine kinase